MFDHLNSLAEYVVHHAAAGFTRLIRGIVLATDTGLKTCDPCKKGGQLRVFRQWEIVSTAITIQDVLIDFLIIALGRGNRAGMSMTVTSLASVLSLDRRSTLTSS